MSSSQKSHKASASARVLQNERISAWQQNHSTPINQQLIGSKSHDSLEKIARAEKAASAQIDCFNKRFGAGGSNGR
ncbi:hypothetical protein SUNI508_10509 [Seiridium unicorne]|uniref:Uncharacterized protein n=1 Tax=Seiridium unicorne TaxID=138068 RepID=A0ABR2UM40_9PEZI